MEDILRSFFCFSPVPPTLLDSGDVVDDWGWCSSAAVDVGAESGDCSGGGGSCGGELLIDGS